MGARTYLRAQPSLPPVTFGAPLITHRPPTRCRTSRFRRRLPALVNDQRSADAFSWAWLPSGRVATTLPLARERLPTVTQPKRCRKVDRVRQSCRLPCSTTGLVYRLKRRPSSKQAPGEMNAARGGCAWGWLRRSCPPAGAVTATACAITDAAILPPNPLPGDPAGSRPQELSCAGDDPVPQFCPARSPHV